MIYHVTFMYLNETPHFFEKAGKELTHYEAIRAVLEQTSDSFVWVYTKEQKHDFDFRMKEQGLESYIVARHEGSSNKNYMDAKMLGRLNTVIMKGKGK